MNPKGFQSRDPYSQEADMICNTLVKEILHARTWAHIQIIIDAIRNVRQREKSHVAEWRHLNPEFEGDQQGRPDDVYME